MHCKEMNLVAFYQHQRYIAICLKISTKKPLFPETNRTLGCHFLLLPSRETVEIVALIVLKSLFLSLLCAESDL